MTDPTDLLAELYRAAADDLDGRDHTRESFRAGGRTWTSLHAAARDLVTNPLAEGVRRRAGLSQLQDWDVDKDTVLKTLRDLADGSEQLDLLRDADADHRIAQVTRMLREAFSWPANDAAPLETIVDSAAQDLKVLRLENRRLREQLAESERRRFETTQG